MSVRSALGRQRPRAVRAVDAGIDALATLRSRIAPASAVTDAGLGGPRVGPRYGGLWQPRDEEQARRLIFNDPDPENFERSGAADAERLGSLISPDAVVLDLGCGIGRVVRYVAPLCATIWAVDASDTMLAYARRRLANHDNVRFARCEGTRIPDVRDDAVDVVYSLITLQHLEREDAFDLLREMRRVLRPGGSAYVTFPNILSDEYLQCFVNYVEQGEVTNPARARLYTPQEVERILPAAGFAIREIQSGTEIVAICEAPAAG